jgi:hypothetical protein
VACGMGFGLSWLGPPVLMLPRPVLCACAQINFSFCCFSRLWNAVSTIEVAKKVKQARADALKGVPTFIDNKVRPVPPGSKPCQRASTFGHHSHPHPRVITWDLSFVVQCH